MSQGQEHNGGAASDGARAKQRTRPRAATGDGARAKQHTRPRAATGDGARAKQRTRPRDATRANASTPSELLREFLDPPVRWLRKQTARASRWLRRRLRFGWSAILDALKRWTKDRGFGYWWLVVTLLLAGAVGLLVAVLLVPVTAIVACLAVAIWLLFRKGTGNSRRQSHRRGHKAGSAATA